MLLALSVLLFTTLTCVGLMALWAATSRWHWFARAMLYLGAISPVLLIPAYEPFVTFVVQGATVAAGVQLARWLRRRKEAEPTRIRLSLRDVLLAMPPIAVLCAVGVRLPVLDVPTWVSVVATGFVAGLVTLLAAWIAAGKRLAWWRRLLISIPLVLLLSLPGVLWDQTLTSLTFGLSWPPDPNVFSVWSKIPSTTPTWLALGLGLLLTCVLLLWAFAPLWRKTNHYRAWRRTLAGCSMVLLLLLATPPAWVYWQLMNPLPIPNDPLPSPNGYDDLVAAADLVPKNPMVDSASFDDETATLIQLQAACQEIQPAILRVRIGLAKEIYKQSDYESDDLVLGHIQEFRTIARGMHAVGKLSQREGRSHEASEQYLELMEYGGVQSRGGLLIDSLVGLACSGIGCRGLYSVRNAIADKHCLRIVNRIDAMESRLEPMETYLHRDRVWTQHVYGWQGHLTQILDEQSSGELSSMFSYEQAHHRHLATLSLLKIEFALRAYQFEHGTWPETLEQLTPNLLTAVPTDPFAADGAPLRYRREDDGFLLYSISQNGVDDGGAPPPWESDMMWRNPEFGDFRLDIHFAPDPAPEEPKVDDESDWVEEMPAVEE